MNEHSANDESPIETDQVTDLEDAGGRMFVNRVLGGTLLVVICCGSLVGFYWQAVGAKPAMLWLGVLLIILTIRIAVVAQTPYREFADGKGWAWRILYPIGLTMLSAWIGVGAGWLVWNTPAADQQMLWLVMISLCALSVNALALLRSWFLLSPILALGGPLYALYATRQEGWATLTAFFVVFLIGLGFFYRRQGGLLTEFVAASQRNQELVQTLRQSTELLEVEINERREAEKRIRESESEVRTLIENVRDLIYRIDADGVFLQISPSCRNVLGYEPEEMIGHNLREFLPRLEIVDEMIAAIKKNKGSLDLFKHEIRRADGSVVWLQLNAHSQRDENGQIISFEGSSRDITDTLRTEQALKAAQNRAQITLDSIADGVITTDINGAVLFLNPVAERLTGWQFNQAEGEQLSRVLRIVERRSGKPASDPVQRCLLEERTVTLSGNLAVHHRVDDTESGIEVTASPMTTDDDQGMSGVVVVLHDVSRVQDMARELSYQASHDQLTGLLNRGEFEVRVNEAIASASKEVEHALLYMDLDQFKVINDSCGHAAGDELLRQLPEQLQPAIRDSDVLARLGGDEFGILLTRCDVDNARRVAETVRQQIKSFRFYWEDKEFELGISVGLVSITDFSGDLTDVLRSADSACHLAKDLGRDRIHVYRQDDQRLADRQGAAQWVQRIRKVLEEDRFELHIQTIKPIKNKALIKSGEILLRMRDEHDKLVPPAAFLPAAERYHLMPRIDRWVVEHTLELIAKRPETLLSYGGISVNLSGQSLNDDSFLDFIIEKMEAFKVPPGKLCFEITETAVIASLYKAGHMIAELKSLGCQFALDDFGSGLSSFQYLKNLNVDKLKIDGAFIKDVATDPVDHAMVKAIVQIGREMGIETIAEYVENGQILACLEELGVDHAQGFYIARPAAIL
jgi:diguanylate cyclase (GGDEF)-like protein/PAS domain S-box-containing protein